VVWDSPDPTYDEGTIDRLAAALRLYTAIEARGGWPSVPATLTKLMPGASSPDVAVLRQRLAITGDLAATAATGDAYDQSVVDGLKHFQLRHGLTPTGTVGPQTLAALNVPVDKRVRQLTASYERLAATTFSFGQRYVVVNIPAAVAEAVAGGKVEHRYVAVVGKPDRPSPTGDHARHQHQPQPDLDRAVVDRQERRRAEDGERPDLSVAHAHAPA